MKNNFLFIALLLCFSISWGQSKITKTEFTKYKLNTNKCLGLIYHTGSQIYIPEGAFGTVPNNKITIKYREFHDKIDMITNNLSMKTIQGKQLESGGMFEIEAEYKGKPIKLAEGKEITVRIAGLKDRKNLDIYLFDKAKNAWAKIKKRFQDIQVKTPENDDDLWGGDAGIETEGGFDGEEFDDWCDDCWESSEEWKQYDSLRFEVFKSMNISEFGFYNYDKILLEDEPAIPFAAKFIIPNDTNKIMDVYVVYNNLNSVITYYGNKVSNFSLVPRQDIRIFTVLKDGRVANFPADKLKKLNIEALKESEYTFELILAPSIPTTGDKLAESTNITR